MSLGRKKLNQKKNYIKQSSSSNIVVEREKRKKTWVVEQVKNLSKLIYIIRACHEIYINCSAISNF